MKKLFLMAFVAMMGLQQNALIFNLPKADDVDECFLNGKLIGSTGRMPTNAAGYFPASNMVRNYVVDVKNDGVRLDAEFHTKLTQ